MHRSLRLEHDVRHIEKWLTRVPECRLLVLDPISALTKSTDGNANVDVRGLLEPLSQLAQSNGVAILAVTHLNKSSTAPIYRINGSIGWVAAARAVYLVAKDTVDEDRRLLMRIKNNLSGVRSGFAFRIVPHEGVPRIEWESGVVDLTPAEVLEAPTGDSPAIREAKGFLRGFLCDGPRSVLDVQRASESAGISSRTLRRGKEALRIKSQKSGYQGTNQWSLPSGALGRKSNENKLVESDDSGQD